MRQTQKTRQAAKRDETEIDEIPVETASDTSRAGELLSKIDTVLGH